MSLRFLGNSLATTHSILCGSHSCSVVLILLKMVILGMLLCLIIPCELSDT